MPEKKWLADTLVDILGKEQLLELLRTKQLASALAKLNIEQRVSLLRALLPLLNEQQVAELFNRVYAQPGEDAAKSKGHNK